MQRPQHWTQLVHPPPTTFHPFLVAVIASDIDAVRSADIDIPVAIEIEQAAALARYCDGGHIETFAHALGERERYPACIGEAEIRESAANALGPFAGFDATRAQGLL